MRSLSRPLTAALFSILLAFGISVHAAEDLSACPQFFANAKPPVVAARPTNRAQMNWVAKNIANSNNLRETIFIFSLTDDFEFPAPRRSVNQREGPSANISFGIR